MSVRRRYDLRQPQKSKRRRSSMELPINFEQWTVEETCQYLQEEGLGQWADKFKERKITGDWLRGLTVANLKGMGIEQLDDCEKILLCIGKLWQIPGKVFNDPIHGHIELHPLLIKIIDTPEFQRLRYIKQLGGVYFVYPGASHNRFEHSIGVAHLAGELVKSLRAQQPELGITHRDVLCVQIAGLCHDLGHGPFSHMFDSMFIPKVRQGKEWKHEKASCEMFDYMVKNNELRTVMTDYGLVLPWDLVFIKEMIVGPLDSTTKEQLQTAFQELKEKLNTEHKVELQDEKEITKKIIVGLLDIIIPQDELQTAFQLLKEKLQTVCQELKEKVKTEHKVELQDDAGFISEIIIIRKDFFLMLKEKVKKELLDDPASNKKITLQTAFQLLKEKLQTPFQVLKEKLQIAFQKLKEKVKMEHDVELQDDAGFISEIIVILLDSTTQKQREKAFQKLQESVLKDWNVELPDDLAFILEAIVGLLDSSTAQKKRSYKGREKNKFFLYEIVANKISGIDVDKFDYFARDCYHLGVQNNFDYRRFLKFARVCDVETEEKGENKEKKFEKQICIRDKEVYNLYNMFHTRYCIHRRACQHRVSSIIQTMIADAFVKADKHFQISKAIDDMGAYIKLTDCVFEQILNYPSKELKSKEDESKEMDEQILNYPSKELKSKEDESKEMDEARKILHRIITRDLYHCLGEIGIKLSTPKDLKKELTQQTSGDSEAAEGVCEDLKKKLTQQTSGDSEATSSNHGKEICKILKNNLTKRLLSEGLKQEDFEVVHISMDYGMEYEDPIEKVRFYRKDKPDKGFKIQREQVSNVLPTYFSDELIRVYYKGTNETELETAEGYFKKCWEELKNKVRSHNCNSCKKSQKTCISKIYLINLGPVPDEAAPGSSTE